MQQFEIGNYAKKQMIEYLNTHQIKLHDAMNQADSNAAIAAILHANFPFMVRKIYSLEKFKTFFWEKRDVLENHISARLAQAEKPKK